MYKKITIRCITNCYNYDLKISDINNNIVDYKKEGKDIYTFYALKDKIYIIDIKVLNHTFRGVIKVCEDYKILFNLNLYINNLQNITFLLEDRNYPGLKIEKGELILWQNLIQ